MFCFTARATVVIYTLSLHDALPISQRPGHQRGRTEAADRLMLGLVVRQSSGHGVGRHCATRDRKSTRLNSSHVEISYAVFCSKKKIIQLTTVIDNATALNQLWAHTA